MTAAQLGTNVTALTNAGFDPTMFTIVKISVGQYGIQLNQFPPADLVDGYLPVSTLQSYATSEGIGAYVSTAVLA